MDGEDPASAEDPSMATATFLIQGRQVDSSSDEAASQYNTQPPIRSAQTAGIPQPAQAGIAGSAQQSQCDSSHPPQNTNLGGNSPHDGIPTNENQHGNRRSRRREERLAKKQAVRIASLNTNGFGSLSRESPDNKWNQIYRTVTQRRIGILLLQEAHLTDDRVDTLHKLYGRKIKILFSSHPTQPTQKEGVAVVINRHQINAKDITTTVVIPGRAIHVSLKHHDRHTTQVLGIYAPTSDGDEERRLFFHELREYYETRPNFPKPNLLAGDFNNVEDPIDRLPAHAPTDPSVPAMDELKDTLHLLPADGWRLTYPNSRDYTFHRGSGPDATFSRLDRIYATEQIFACAREWRIEQSGVRTDHAMVMVDIWTPNAPDTGHGRPVFPLRLLRNKTLKQQMKNRGREAIAELEDLMERGVRTETENPQIILNKLKRAWMKMARELERRTMPRILAELGECERQLEALKADRTTEDADKTQDAALLTDQIRRLKQRHFKEQQNAGRLKHRLEGERPTKYWTRLHKPAAPREIMFALEKNPNRAENEEPCYETDTAKMAELARHHHNEIQKDGPEIKPEDERAADIRMAVGSITVGLCDDEANMVGGDIDREECEVALRFSKSGSAPGLDGIPYEVWKALHERYKEDSRHEGRETMDVMLLLHSVFRDIQTHGVCASTPFAEGWMAPIYKEKGERTKIANYRPITLLNTDYKLLTKVLSMRL
ncbi:Endonuclease/exonuclease/phosphatase, partial [Ganoderma leucocontextum]